ncbi:arthropod defensin domain-containing protein [Purpureocillium lavendulum]|uniref:Arthropod defensin domain-containing protein n=1 Tax=Purpureocillium lavendulum TaxID=1247861 RepID=A0AB34FGS3_9HYPO|nr:arthropod defensin domain-containing protein [Purpureocillium lavendulum]
MSIIIQQPPPKRHSKSRTTIIMRFILAALASASLASALCMPSLTCEELSPAADKACNGVCIRQGNPKGGRCLPKDGCPGANICACFPRKRAIYDRSTDTEDGPAYEDGDALLRRDLEATLDAGRPLADNVTLADRSICCINLPGYSGLCCEAHCRKIGKPGGSCTPQNICTCN